jgi:hypothetical protein
MLTEIESDILRGAMNHARAEGEYVQITTSPIARKETNEIYAWKDIYSDEFPVSNELYENWILKNQEPVSLENFSEAIEVKFTTWKEFDSISSLSDKEWSVLYSFSRPGISNDGIFALVQITAFCPSGPPNYGSIFLLEKSTSGWVVKFNHGLYNQ